MTFAYYLDDWADEVMPCSPDLTSWALWLSRPDPAWQRTEGAADRDRFKASVIEFGPDIVASRMGSRWHYERPADDVGFLAVRWSEGKGWSPENIIDGEDMARALDEWFGENDHLCQDVEYIAVGRWRPAVMLTYRNDPVPILEVSQIN